MVEHRPAGTAAPTAPAGAGGDPPVRDGDEVDAIVRAWRRERPDLDVSPLAVLSRVSRLARHLDRRRRAVFEAHALETWEFDVLAALRRSGPPYQLTPGALLRQTMVTSGTMTTRVDRLARRGLVDRAERPEDRRQVLVGITDTGRQAVDAALTDLLAVERTLLDGLDRSEQTSLAASLRHLLMEQERG